MSAGGANAIARARALWPHVADAEQALFEAWLPWAMSIAGTGYGARRQEAIAHALAHAVTRAQDGASPTGEVTSVRTLSLSASYGATGSDEDLATTRPGQALLALRRATPRITMPVVV